MGASLRAYLQARRGVPTERVVGGVRQVVAKEVDFGASDVPLAAAELEKRGLFQFPTLVGGIVPVVNVPGVPAGTLRLDSATLAAIFAGQVERWSDPAIRALNPGLTLPNLPIVRVVRADGSGTTEVFVRFLRESAPEQAAPIEPQGGKALWPGKVLAVGGSGFAPLPIATQARIVALLSDFRTSSGQGVPVLAVKAGQR